MKSLMLMLACSVMVSSAYGQDKNHAQSSCAGLEVNDQILGEFSKAWRASELGHSNRESAMLLFLMSDGSILAKPQDGTHERDSARFNWHPSARAIVHTHPNLGDPKPSNEDRRVAHRLQVPIFTLTIRGMYVYDPQVKKTCKLHNGLDWLEQSKWSRNLRLAAKR
jgi:hypothetical protein